MIPLHNRSLARLLLLVTIGLFVSTLCETCTQKDDQFLFTFHPHLDAFWLNTDNELKDINFRPAGFLYNMNQRNSKTIFNSMMASLKASPIRKYFVTEAVFFKDWYDYTTPENKQKVKQFMQNGQLQISNGAWVENDEAVVYYDDMLDQYTLGMNYLYEEFDYQVKIGWATDSFGHSHSQAALLHLLGVQFQGIERVDDRFVNQHHGGPLLEFYWDTISDSNNKSYGGVLNHVRHFLHEVNNLRYPQVEIIKQDFKQVHEAMKNSYYKKNKGFRFLGNDFQQFIPEEFTTLQQVMGLMNKQSNKQTCPAFKYGNPQDYLQLLATYYDKNTLPTRKYDLMPNWDQDRYWTGYYTTDPALKKICKDFSRIVNFYRKSLLVSNAYEQNAKKLQQNQQLLAVMQHHDGITATSKTYIQDQFKNRMASHTTQIVKKLKQLHGAQNCLMCNLYQNHNECEIKDQDVTGQPFKTLDIITHGGSKKQKIQLHLPNGIFYDIEQVEEDVFCDNGKCVLVFEASLHPGVNKFTLASKAKQQMTSATYEMETVQGKVYNGRDYTISAENQAKNGVRYEYGDGEYFDIGLFTSPNQGSSRQTMAWNKYGSRQNKVEHVNAGMYIMSNTGKIQPIQETFSEFKFVEGKIYKRAILTSAVSKLILTIKTDEPNIIDIVHTFKPASRSMVDYFMKVSSSVKSDTLYHDANGFLVAKRPLNKRPDYQFEAKPEDIINGNTYPVCSFAYLIDSDKKFLFFTDRANGVAAFEKDLLINFDRLASDDGKGVGQAYTRQNKNTFRYKFALISTQDDLQRTWQREYDEALIGFFNKQNSNVHYRKDSVNQISHIPGNGPISNLKYSIFYLNKDQFVIRFQNLAEFSNLIFNKFSAQVDDGYRWHIEQLGIDIYFKDVAQSYANGIVKEKQGSEKWRRFWGKGDNNMITVMNQNLLDKDENKLTLRPLQIRSFRINRTGKISPKVSKGSIAKQNPVLQQLNNAGNLRSFRTRCF